LEVNVKDKIVEIWLTNSDKEDDEASELVDEICRTYSGRKYRTAVFISGNGSLEDCTENLLCSNI